MDDNSIIALYFDRSEEAISETAARYGGYCFQIAYNILTDHEDAEESVNDTYLAAWNVIPPRRPSILAAFLGKITRHLSIDRWRSRRADKRGGGEIVLALEELGDCVSGRESVESAYTRKELIRRVNELLSTMPETERSVFLCRYWYMDSIAEVAGHFGFTEAKVNSMLHRTRSKLRAQLKKEGLL